MYQRTKVLLLLTLISLYFQSGVHGESNNVPLPPGVSIKQERSINKLIKSDESTKDKSTKVVPDTEAHTESVQHKPISTDDEFKNVKIHIGLNKNESDLYLPLASAICIIMNEKNSDACRVTQYDDSIKAAHSMLNGDVDILITHSMLEKNIVDSKEPFDQNMQAKKLRFITSFFSDELIILSRRQSHIKKLDDLKNTKINVTKANTKTRMLFDNLMQLKKWSPDDFQQISELNLDEQIKAICNNEIDAIIMVAEKKNNHVKTITRFCEINFVRMNQEELDLFKHDPQYTTAKILGGTYIGIPNDIDTIGIKAVLLTTSDVTNKQSYLLFDTIFRNLKTIKHLHSSFDNISIETMLNDGRSAQLHDGVSEFINNNGYASIVRNFSMNH